MKSTKLYLLVFLSAFCSSIFSFAEEDYVLKISVGDKQEVLSFSASDNEEFSKTLNRTIEQLLLENLIAKEKITVGEEIISQIIDIWLENFLEGTDQEAYEKFKKKFYSVDQPDAFPENIVVFKENFKKNTRQDALLWKLAFRKIGALDDFLKSENAKGASGTDNLMFAIGEYYAAKFKPIWDQYLKNEKANIKEMDMNAKGEIPVSIRSIIDLSPLPLKVLRLISEEENSEYKKSANQ
jgi:hypothetical protein